MTAAVSVAQGGSNNLTMRNRIINGAMMIDQRNAGASVTVGNGNTYTVDRWQISTSQASKLSAQQNAGSVTPPAGYTKYLGITSLSAYSVGASDVFGLRQMIEGFNVADMGFGTANAQTFTVSFWVRSSLTGTFGGSIQSSDQARGYAFTFAINAANTWEQKFITIAGDTSGTWNKDNTTGLYLTFGLGCGSSFSAAAGSWLTQTYINSSTGATSVVGTNGATFYITGVQLEAGTTATPFEQRLYGTELALCQRYCYVDNSTGQGYVRFPMSYASSTTQSLMIMPFPVTMRTAPSLTWSGPFHETLNSGGGTSGSTASITTDGNNANHASLIFNMSSGTLTLNSLNAIRILNSTSWYARFEAEL